MNVTNIMEDIIQKEIIKNLNQLHMSCTCEHCLSDVLALSLNELPPRYIVNQERSPYVRAIYEADRQGSINILKTISKAAKLVSDNRRCGLTRE
ncbi:late competence development ComFB family protein [Lederbergia citrea]|uniref:Late competence development ComFB family protein n=1 Tax=Lederbergia citrea TaxID=2833581 RepID=A0A942US50_9BACI|nr:late competence development ComFB family protein [Lederbergia citrea]MBS4224066.1 late competence development ComFB family protein [Lederbergia citrea]